MVKVFCLMGPTASGKTGLSLALAQHYPFEIINVDSAMVYRGMDIGTAKPSPAERQNVPHHLVDIKDPHEAYSAGEFCDDANALIDDIDKRGKLPLLVGGTMMYFKALQDGIAPLPSSDEGIRARLWEEGEKVGWPVLHERLKACDPESAASIHANDKQRIQRALAVYELSGTALSVLQKEAKPSHHAFISMAIIPENRAQLHKRIAQRVDAMLADGFADEVQRIAKLPGVSPEVPAMRAVGYRQWWMHLQGQYNTVEAREAMVAATRQLAKRQLTWLRSWPNLHVLNMDEDSMLEQAKAIIDQSIG